MTVTRLIVGLFGITFLFGCLEKDPVREAARQILRLPEQQRRQALARLPVGKQLDIDMYDATSVEPPGTLAPELAPNWKALLPLVRSRMDTETDDNRLSEYMMILFTISATQCSLANRSDILSTAEQSLSRFRLDRRGVAENFLKDIRDKHRNLPNCE